MNIDICENCYEEANIVAEGVCKSCLVDMNETTETPMLDNNVDDFVGVMSDDDVVDMFRDEFVETELFY